jgi:molybdopterin-containing oxidoreductase family membrane subunit
MGMIPDLATLRDRATEPWRRLLYGALAMGWRNSARHWHRYETAYLLLGGLATPLVISVHSVVSSDFAIAIVPGWHETVFPPYFVAGAIFSGFAMVLVLCIPIRHFYRLHAFITDDHLDVMGKLILATSLLTSYGYLSEQFTTYYGGDPIDMHVYWYRLTDFGKYAAIVWTLFTCNSVVPQALWIRPLRRNPVALFVVSIVVLIGMWFERYMIIASSLSEDFLPSAFGFFKPTIWDILTYVGSIGFFFALFLLFVGFMPILSMSEMRALLPGSRAPEVGR